LAARAISGRAVPSDAAGRAGIALGTGAAAVDVGLVVVLHLVRAGRRPARVVQAHRALAILRAVARAVGRAFGTGAAAVDIGLGLILQAVHAGRPLARPVRAASAHAI